MEVSAEDVSMELKFQSINHQLIKHTPTHTHFTWNHEHAWLWSRSSVCAQVWSVCWTSTAGTGTDYLMLRPFPHCCKWAWDKHLHVNKISNNIELKNQGYLGCRTLTKPLTQFANTHTAISHTEPLIQSWSLSAFSFTFYTFMLQLVCKMSHFFY